MAPAPAAGPLTVQATPPTTGLTARQVGTADMDGDGQAEIVVAGTTSGGSGEVRVLRAGALGYTVLASLPTSATGNFGLSDLNNDGAIDLVLSDAAAGGATVTVFFNPGTGIFGSTPDRTATAGPGAAKLQFADLDADGDLDLLAVNTDDTVSKRFNDGTGGLLTGSWPTNTFVNVRTVLPIRLVGGADGVIRVTPVW